MGVEGEWSKVVRRRQNVKNEGCPQRQKPDVAVGSVGRQVDNPVTFFFTNFPEEFGAKEMLKNFQHYGKFSEVVIPAKRNGNGRRFGFARAVGVEDPRRLGIKLDNIFLGCNKIFVNLPKYEREALNGGSKAVDRWYQSKCSRREVDEVKHEGSSEGDTGLKQQHKYGGKVVRQPAKNQARKMHRHGSNFDDPLRFEVENETIQEVNKCFVGKVRISGSSYSIQEEFHRKGFVSIKVTPLGSNLVLLEGKDDDDVPKMINDAYEWIGNRFEEIRSWHTSAVDDERHVWLRCSGVPVHAWSDKFFEFISACFGEFVEVDDNTHAKKCMDVARIQIKIRSNNTEPVNSTLRILINGEPFLLKVVEEWCGSVHWATQKGMIQMESSAGASSGAGGASPLEEDEEISASVCEMSAHSGAIEVNNDEKRGFNEESAHAGVSGESEDINYDGWVAKPSPKKEEVKTFGNVRKNVTCQVIEKEGVADEEVMEQHVEEVSRSCKVVGLKVLAHKGCKLSVADGCFLGQNSCNSKGKVESCMDGTNSKKEGLCMAGANSKGIINVPQFSAQSCSNKTLSTIASDFFAGGSGILTSKVKAKKKLAKGRSQMYK